MKVELEKLNLGVSPMTNEVYIGIMNKAKNQWLKKQNITNDFIGCVLERFENKTEIIFGAQSQWEITCKKIK